MKFIVRKLLPASAAMVIVLSFTMAPALTTVEPAFAAASCPTPSTSLVFSSGNQITQLDNDDPVRQTPTNADKNLEYRGWTSTGAAALSLQTIFNPKLDHTPPPQLATIFNPTRPVTFVSAYRVNNWVWVDGDSTQPGSSGGPDTDWDTTLIGMASTPGEQIRNPCSGYNPGPPWGTGGALVLFANADSITLTYTRNDSVALGYVVHIIGVNVDPNLLASYNNNDGGNRYVYQGGSFNLTGLKAGQVLGTAAGSVIKVAIRDSGTFMDPRSINDWWQVTSWDPSPYTPPGPGLTGPDNGAVMKNRAPVFTWTGMPGTGNTYKIEIGNDSGFSSMVTTPAASAVLTYTASPDLVDHTYFWRVRAFNSSAVEIGMSSVRTFTVDNIAPSVPSPSTPTNGTLFNSSATLTWAASTGSPTKYRVEYAPNAGFTGSTLTGEISGLSFTTPSLTVGNHYYWRVQARDAAGNWSAFSTAFNFGIKPAKPTLVTANGTPFSTSTPTLAWNLATGAAHYEIQVDNSPWSSPEYENLNVGTTGVTADLTSDPDGTYSWWVRAVSAAGDPGDWSLTRTFSLNRKPPAPTGLTPTGASSDTTPNFAWTSTYPLDSAATDYSITVKQGTTVIIPPTPFTDNDAVCDADTSCSLTEPWTFVDGTYTYTITPSNSYGTGPTASGSFTVDTTAPAIPVNSSPKNLSIVTKALVKVSVKAVKTATEYDFEITPNPDCTSTTVITGSNTKSYFLATLPDYCVYSFRAKASDAAGNESDWSYPYSFSYSLMRGPKNNTSTTDTTPAFSWGSFTGATSWEVVYNTNPDPTGAIPIAGTYKGYTAVAPLDYGVYYWSLRINGGTWMPVQTFTVSRMGKPAINAVTSDTTPAFSWQTYTGAPGWRLEYGAVEDPNTNTPVSPDLLGTARGYTALTPLDYGLYFWSVLDTGGTDWMPVRSFYLTRLAGPKNGSFTTDTTPSFKWSLPTGTTAVHLYVSTNENMSGATLTDLGVVKSYTPLVPMTRVQQYYWYVVIDTTAGSQTMPVWSFIIQ